jgi:hypothetical protein
MVTILKWDRGDKADLSNECTLDPYEIGAEVYVLISELMCNDFPLITLL